MESLCPTFDSRKNYIDWVYSVVGKKRDLMAIDMGTGASLIYPLLGNRLYNWKFHASEIHGTSY